MNIKELLADLKETYITLKPSPVHGIGVFAIRDIPQGCRDMFSKDNGEWLKVPIAEIDALPEASKDLVETYCVYDEEHYYIPDYGFKKMDLVNYLNHSAQPNVRSVNDGEFFEAITDIFVGQELLINYEAIVKVEGY
jgi:SET domain-containing protein